MGNSPKRQKLTYVCKFILLAVLASSLTLVGCSTSGAKLRGTSAPSTRFMALNTGETVALDDYRGKTVVLSFWATSCRSSGPNIKRLANYAQSFNGDKRVAFIAISLDKNENLEVLKDRIRFDHFESLEHMFSGNEEYDEAYLALQGERLPYFLVIDKNGKIVDADNDDSFIYDLVKPDRPYPLAKK